jgi:cytosine/adenosine deaminase-related metal-dependent hydrolase
MTSLLIEHAEVLVTMDSDRREIADGAIFTDDRQILCVGTSREVRKWILDKDEKADRVIDASGTVIIPGLVNCHHHLFQTLTRSVGTAQGLSLFDWLKTLYPIWGEMDAEAVYVSAKLGQIGRAHV